MVFGSSSLPAGIRESSLMASGWSPKPVLRVQVSALPLTETIRLSGKLSRKLDEEHVSKTCSGNHSVASSSLAVSALMRWPSGLRRRSAKAFRLFRRGFESRPHRLEVIWLDEEHGLNPCSGNAVVSSSLTASSLNCNFVSYALVDQLVGVASLRNWIVGVRISPRVLSDA